MQQTPKNKQIVSPEIHNTICHVTAFMERKQKADAEKEKIKRSNHAKSNHR